MRGYHTYHSIWDASLGEELPCRREPENRHDPFAVAVVRAGVTVGHVPRRISSICSLFIRRDGSISCRVAGSRRYSEDLPQGGLEIPCILTFKGGAKDIEKSEKLVRSAFAVTVSGSESPKNKKRKLNVSDCQTDKDSNAQLQGILNGEKLTDQHIHIAQCLIKRQFPHIEGLQSSLLQSKPGREYEAGTDQLQIVHSRGDHWVLASTVGCENGKVNVYDSVYSSLDEMTKQVVFNLFNHRPINMIDSQRQEGGMDCGLFVVANATAIAFGVDPSKAKFKQVAMRAHLAKCFEEEKISLFPIV